MIPQKFYIFIHIFLIYLLLSALGIETYVFHQLNLELNKVIDKETIENQELSNKLAETEKSWNEKWSKRNWEACGGPFEVCKFIPTSRKSFMAINTSRSRETTYSITLPTDWELNSWSGQGLAVDFSKVGSVGQSPSGSIFAMMQSEEKEKRVNCVSNPENATGISPELKNIFLKYKNFKTEFGNVKLSWEDGNANTNKFNLCQAKEEGHIDWITDTIIGYVELKADEEDYKEFEKILNSITAAKVHQTIFQ